jgi:hypothetical protein
MSVSICLVPLVVEVELSVVELTKHLVNAWPSLPAVEDLQDNERTSSFTVGIANVILGYIPTGFPGLISKVHVLRLSCGRMSQRICRIIPRT